MSSVRPLDSPISPHTGSTARRRTGGQILVDALLVHGADRIYCVPGESYLAALDALRDAPGIQVVVCRHEGAAANMAEADGKLTGKPGLCFVTRGPGATHASVGVHTAAQDSTPMILLIGQVDRASRGREAFQEIDYRQMFGSIAKWVDEISDPARIPELVARAYRTATSGRPGPVVLSIPEDVLPQECEVDDTIPYRAVQPSPSESELAEVRARLAGASRPLMILGGGGWTERAWEDIAAFVESNGLPVATAWRFQHLFDNRHPSYVGVLGLGPSPRLAARVKSADLLFVIGARLGEATTNGYTTLVPPNPPAPLIHVHACAEELGSVYQPVLEINSGMPQIAAGLRQLSPLPQPQWRTWREDARAEHEEYSRLPAGVDAERPFGTSDVMAQVERIISPDAIVTNGAGNFAIWVHRYHAYRRRLSQLAPTSGAMGYGLPAAIAAKLRHPEKQVVCFAGDGDLMMYPQELLTAVMQELPIVVIVINNGMYGSVRMYQERHYPGRAFATDLLNPDFPAMARAFGLEGARVRTAPEFAAAFERALAASGPTLIEVPVDPAQMTPDVRLDVRAI